MKNSSSAVRAIVLHFSALIIIVKINVLSTELRFFYYYRHDYTVKKTYQKTSL